MFRSCGITGFHNSVGVGGATAYDDALNYIAAWSGFVGAQHRALLAGRASPTISIAPRRKQKIAVIMGLQNADEFREAEGRQGVLPARPALRAADLQHAEPARQRLDRARRRRRQRLRRRDHQGDERGRHARRRLASGDRTTLDAIELSPKPIAITHSNCRALNNHPRLKTDEAIRSSRPRAASWASPACACSSRTRSRRRSRTSSITSIMS